MYIFGILNLIGMIVCIFFIPSELNKSPKEEEETDDVKVEDVIIDDENEQNLKK